MVERVLASIGYDNKPYREVSVAAAVSGTLTDHYASGGAIECAESDIVKLKNFIGELVQTLYDKDLLSKVDINGLIDRNHYKFVDRDELDAAIEARNKKKK